MVPMEAEGVAPRDQIKDFAQLSGHGMAGSAGSCGLGTAISYSRLAASPKLTEGGCEPPSKSPASLPALPSRRTAVRNPSFTANS